MKNRIKRIVGTAWLLLLAIGCQREPISPTYVGEIGKKVEVELSFRLQQPTTPHEERETRSSDKGFVVKFGSEQDLIRTRTAHITTLYNLYVFQFKADGTPAQPPVLINEVAASSSDNIVQLPVTLTVGIDQTLYLVALGKALGDNLMGISSLAALKRYPFTYVEAINGVYSSKIKSEEDVPFAGTIDGVNVVQLESGNTGLIQYNVPEGFSGGISLHRLISKVTLNYAFDVKEYKASGVRLKSVPSQFQIEPSPNDKASYVDMEMQLPDPAITYNTPSWYIAPNKQGVVETILIESERYHRFNDETGASVKGNAPVQASYFEVWTKQDASTDYVVYQVYIGNNNTSDFNIESNNYYTINTLINGDISSISNDNRVRTFSVKHLVELWNSSDGYDIDAHYDFRPIVINTDGRTVTVGIYKDFACTKQADDDDWMQVSTYPNYTLAKTANSLSNHVTIDVAVPSKVTLYLYNDEFIPDDLSSTKKRTLYVKVVTTTLNLPTDIKSTNTFRMDQCPPINIGLFGGTFDEKTGYQSNLVVDVINEMSQNYVKTLPPPLATSYSCPFGYDGVDTKEYGTENATHGTAATRALAENEKGYIIDKTNAIPQTNGDLYQYTYYNSFPAKFCYDRNRDLNGNGVIDNDELKWYLPAINQIMGYWLYCEDAQSNIYGDIWSTNRRTLSLIAGHAIDAKLSPIRCVRDINKK